MTLSEILSVSATGFIVVLIVLILLAVIIVMLSKVIQAVEGGVKNTEDAPEADIPASKMANSVCSLNCHTDKGTPICELYDLGERVIR